MSRSFKHQPFAAICGGGSAKRDKVNAHRGERRAQNLAIRMAWKFDTFEDLLIPHKRECSWNEVYCWNRDGNQRWCGLTAHHWHEYLEAQEPDASEWDKEHYGMWPPEWFKDMMRK